MANDRVLSCSGFRHPWIREVAVTEEAERQGLRGRRPPGSQVIERGPKRWHFRLLTSPELQGGRDHDEPADGDRDDDHTGAGHPDRASNGSGVLVRRAYRYPREQEQ